MLRKSFSASGFVALATVAAVWLGCGSDDPATVPQNDTDAGTVNRTDSGSNTRVDSGAGNGDGTGGLDGGVQITYGTCETFSACGGDLVGDWKVTGGCLDKSTFDAARLNCPTLQESDVKIEATGTLDFTATQLTRDTKVRLTGKVFVPTNSDACPDAKNAPCLFLGAGLTAGAAGLAFDTATCTDTAAPEKGCNCNVSKTITDNATQPYSTPSTGTLRTENPTQQYNYCVNGASSTYLQTSQGSTAQTIKLYVKIGKQ